MEIQDRIGTKTPEDLERKYNLTSLAKNLSIQKADLQNLSNDLQNFVTVTIANIQTIQNQVDGSLSTWFFSGLPTLSNSPAVDWITDENKNMHVGDLYYDKDTGFSYRFLYDSDTSSYIWFELNDSQITQALAIANAAQDTADSKRRVFVVQPIPPYDNGDLWLYNGDLYRCQISKASGTYSSSDFILATKYTDDTIAIQVGNDLTVLSGEVLTIRQDVDNVTTTLSRDYYTKSNVDGQINIISQQQSTLSQTVDGLNFEIDNIQVNGVSKIVTSTGFWFKDTGLYIYKSDSPVSTFISQNGMFIKKGGYNVLAVDSTGVHITCSVTLDETNGLVAKTTTGINRTKTTLNATDGIKIEKSTDGGTTFPTKLFWVDTNGNLNLTGMFTSYGTNSNSHVINGVIQVINSTYGKTIEIGLDPIQSFNPYIYSSDTLVLSNSHGMSFTLGVNLNSIKGHFVPNTGNTYNLGDSGLRFNCLYAYTSSITTSDERLKQQVNLVPDEWLDAWSEVNYVVFKFNEAVELKGEDARWHIGLLAQEIDRVFSAKGLDACKIGLLCYDEWEDTYEDAITPDGEHYKKLVKEAGNIWSIRSDECQFLEMALMRRELNKLKGVA